MSRFREKKHLFNIAIQNQADRQTSEQTDKIHLQKYPDLTFINSE